MQEWGAELHMEVIVVIIQDLVLQVEEEDLVIQVEEEDLVLQVEEEDLILQVAEGDLILREIVNISLRSNTNKEGDSFLLLFKKRKA